MNKMRICPKLIMALAIAASIGSTMSTTALADDYAPGFLWNRAIDWVPGTGQSLCSAVFCLGPVEENL